ncbi:MAG: lipid A biosynthesis acyltransferase [Campylobacterales bacterium]
MQAEQRGSGWSIKIAYFIYKLFGYRVLFYLLYPIAGFYYLLSPKLKVILKNYYSNIGLEFSELRYFEHLRHFAICMTDRFLSIIEPKTYSFDIEDSEFFHKELEKGVVLLMSHFGGWAVAPNCFLGGKVNAVMNEQMIESIKSIEDSLVKKREEKQKTNIIDLSEGTISVAIKTANALSNKEIVAMMGDRVGASKSSVVLKFFGKDAEFNRNPFDIAYKCKKDLVVSFIVFKSIRHYEYIYRFISFDHNRDIDEAVREAMEIYIKMYEDILREYPYQWFNLYNFWLEDR